MATKNSSKPNLAAVDSPTPELSTERRLDLALSAAWEIEAPALTVRGHLPEIGRVSELRPEIVVSALLDRMLVVADARIDAVQPGEGDAAEMERVLHFAPTAEASHG